MAFDLVNFVEVFVSVYGIFAIMAISLNLEYGYGGQPNFGQVLFYGLGAFSAGIVSATLLPWLAGMSVGDICSSNALTAREVIASTNPLVSLSSWWIALIVAMAVAALFGYIASYPAIRVKEEWYLSMILLVAAEIFRTLVRNTPQFGCGFNGLPGISNPFAWIGNFIHSSLSVPISTGVYALVILLIALACYFIAQKLSNSPFGRLLKSVRDDKVAAEALGKDVNKIRIQVMVIGSAMAGLAGALYVFYIGVAISEDYISAVTFSVWVMMVLGGIANNKGILIGTAILIGIQRGTQFLGISLQTAFPGLNANLLSYASYLFQATLLIVLIIYRPKGVLPEGRIETKAYKIFDFSKANSTLSVTAPSPSNSQPGTGVDSKKEINNQEESES